MSYQQVLDYLLPIASGLLASLAATCIAFFVARRLQHFSLKRSSEQKRSDPTNVNAGRAWATVAQLAPYAVYAVALALILSTFPFDIAGIVAALAAGAFGVALAMQDVLQGLAAKFIIVGSDIFRPGNHIGLNDTILIVESIGPTHTECLDPARDARRLIPNKQLVTAEIVNYDDEPAAKFVQILPSDSSFKDYGQIDKFERIVSTAILPWSIGDKKASCELVNVAGDAYEFRLVGFTEHPSEHPQATVDLYHEAIGAALNANFSIGRTNNNTFGNPLQVINTEV